MSEKEKKKDENIDDVVAKELTFFSLQGTFGRVSYLAIFMFWHMILTYIAKLDNLIILQIVYVIAFCSVISAVQKRCRDLNLKGTFFIFVFSMAYPLLQYFNYMKLHDLSRIALRENFFVGPVAVACLFMHLYLLLAPGKKDKNLVLISPLLRYPLYYFGLWIVLYFIGFYHLFHRVF